jgi:hypothetical protein
VHLTLLRDVLGTIDVSDYLECVAGLRDSL